MSIIRKGKKGFQSLPSDQKKDKKGVYYLTAKEMKILKEYCIKNDTKPSLLIRELIADKVGFKKD